MKRQTVEEYAREVAERRRMTEKKERRCGNCDRYACTNARFRVGVCKVYTKSVIADDKACTNWKEKRNAEC